VLFRSLTPAGAAALRRAWQVVRAHEERVLAGIEASDRPRLLAWLNDVAPADASAPGVPTVASVPAADLAQSRTGGQVTERSGAAVGAPAAALHERNSRRRRGRPASRRAKGPSRPP
jgi:hypothetical protein